MNKHNNYLTINKGELDGVRPEMGVVVRHGVVGSSIRFIALCDCHAIVEWKVEYQLPGTGNGLFRLLALGRRASFVCFFGAIYLAMPV